MSLAQEDIEFIKAHLGEWLVEAGLGKPAHAYEIELRERMVRVEEELKHQRELMRQGFERMDKRFEAMDKRFEAMDKRFEALNRRLDRFFLWSLGVIVTGTGAVMGVLWYLLRGAT
jgi:predicted nuclease with TOPRIM domain